MHGAVEAACASTCAATTCACTYTCIGACACAGSYRKRGGQPSTLSCRKRWTASFGQWIRVSLVRSTSAEGSGAAVKSAAAKRIDRSPKLAAPPRAAASASLSAISWGRRSYPAGGRGHVSEAKGTISVQAVTPDPTIGIGRVGRVCVRAWAHTSVVQKGPWHMRLGSTREGRVNEASRDEPR